MKHNPQYGCGLQTVPLENLKVSQRMGIVLSILILLLMLIFLATLLGTLSSMLHSRVALENLALRHPVAVLQRSARKRPKLTPADRLLWGWLSRLWNDWRSALVIVKPETVVAWHRVPAFAGSGL
jgi:hypothetical protein